MRPSPLRITSCTADNAEAIHRFAAVDDAAYDPIRTMAGQAAHIPLTPGKHPQQAAATIHHKPDLT